MIPARQFTAAAATALSLVAGAAFVCLFPVADARAQASPGSCEDEAQIAILPSPIAPWKGAPLRVVFAAEEPLDGELSLTAPDGSVAAKSRDRYGGPPYFWFAETASPAPGTWIAKLTRDGTSGACGTIAREITVAHKEPPRAGATSKGVWPVRAAWDREMENLYSAWIEKLFDAPLDEAPSWPALHEVLRDPSRNILFNHLGWREDEKKLIIRPDCADLPYFLRAYFAFKMGLPFGYANCTRGGGGKPPHCPAWWNIQKEEPPPVQRSASSEPSGLFGARAAPAPAIKVSRRPAGLVPGFGHYLRVTVANGVHSGSGRTAADDDSTDYYPVSLSEKTLRPGTVYADPYGHILVLVRRLPQSDGAAGVFLAVDGQPDGTVARKRFWRGNFLFAQDPALGSAGFKRFRPIVREKNGALRRLTNAEIAKDPQYGDFSLDQSQLEVEDFYDRMDEVMSPVPLDPVRALKEAITSLEEQVHARVTSVENGRKYQTGGGATVAIPDGASIFETTGAWEDFATPSRDLRLLIAIDVVRGLPDRVARRPERYAMPQDKGVAEVKVELESVLASELPVRKFSYTRSDGSQWKLTLKDVIDRMAELEMAYNVNDCVELRWGAPDNSDEASTCKRQAPKAQRAKMAEYRAWFNERRRPPRL
ncbi:MAG: hypothetical protein ACRECF_02945 [Methyloceanibacter sp.]